MSGISLFLATYDRRNEGSLSIELIEKESNNQIVGKKIDTSNLVDNSYYTLNFGKVDNSAGKEYVIRVYSIDSIPGHSVTIWTSDDDIYHDGELKINNVAQQKDLNFMVFDSKNKLEQYLLELHNIPMNYYILLSIIILLGFSINCLLLFILNNFYVADKEYCNEGE
ncbi:hypothetical protein D3C76_1010840 [compost metagenome]